MDAERPSWSFGVRGRILSMGRELQMTGALRRIVGVPILIAFLVGMLVVPMPAGAEYRDRSGELEGTDPTPYLIVGGVVVVGVVVYLVLKHKAKDSDAEKQKETEQSLTFPRRTTPSAGTWSPVDRTPAGVPLPTGLALSGSMREARIGVPLSSRVLGTDGRFGLSRS